MRACWFVTALFNIAFWVVLCLVPGSLHAARHALLIGISDYTDPAIVDLEGPRNDVQALQAILISKWNYSPSNVRTLLDGEATAEKIRQALGSLLQSTSAGDDVLVYFSGHGSSSSDPRFGRLLNLPDDTGALVASDFSMKAAKAARTQAQQQQGQMLQSQMPPGLIVGRTDLRPIFRELDQDRRVLVIFDACYSGNASRSAFSPYAPATRRQISWLPEAAVDASGEIAGEVSGDTPEPSADSVRQKPGKVEQSAAFDYQQLVYFGAAADDQFAVDITQSDIATGIVTTHDGKAHGGFTDALLRVLADDTVLPSNDSLTYGRLFNLVRGRFEAYCAQCGHTPVSLPFLGSRNRELLLQPFLETDSGTVPAAQSSGQVVNDSIEKDREKSLPGRRLVIELPNGFKSLTARVQADSRMEVDSARPEVLIRSSLHGTVAYSADGQLLSRFGESSSDDELFEWLELQSWLKLRVQLDNRQSVGDLRVDLNLPMLSNSLSTGDSVYFRIVSAKAMGLLVVLADSNGQLSVLYPSSNREIDRPIGAGELLEIPEAGETPIIAGAPYGTDHLFFYGLPVRHPLLARLANLAVTDPAGVSHPLLNELFQTLDSGELVYSAAHIALETVR